MRKIMSVTLRNNTSHDCHLWCRCVKWYLQVFFQILKFWFSRLSRTWNDKKNPKMTKISVCCTLYFSNHISYGLHLWYTCMHKRIISPGIFFSSEFWFSGSLRGRGRWKGLKWQNFVSVSLLISVTVHHMIVIFGTHV